MSQETGTSAAYDVIADEYTALFDTELDTNPDVGLIDALAAGVVVDVGCGPGRATRRLVAASSAPCVLGVDASRRMIEIARTRCRRAAFTVGRFEVLPLPDASADAVCAWYAIVNTPPSGLDAVFGEFRRVLRPGGRAVVAFATDAPTLTVRRGDMALDFLRHDLADVTARLVGTGFGIEHAYRRAAAVSETSPQAFVVARG